MLDQTSLTTLIRDATKSSGPLDAAAVSAIVAAISEEDRVRARHRDLINDRQRMNERHRAEQLNLDRKFAELQLSCKHRLRKYNGDPAGGSDSFYSCPTCGWTSS